jgi:branched-chain amino acid transport system ATP-binding protein
MSNNQRLRVEQIIMQFAGLRALNNVSLELRPGEIVGLIGPNGSGKTTLINVITGFLKPTQGRVLVDDQETTGWPPNRIAQASVRRTFQTIRLFKGFSVLENVEAAAVALGARRPEARAQARETLDRLGIGWLAAQRAGALPYGEERRVEIARALVTRPRYLMLDEPAAGLNEIESDALLNTLSSIVRDIGCGMLIIDHDMRLIMRLCDRLHVLNYGMTIAEGEPRAVRAHPDVIAAYLGAETRKGGRAQRR